MPKVQMSTYRYQVTLMPNVSIAPRRFVRVVETDGPRPWDAVQTAMEDINRDETHLWQSDDATIRVERVA